MAAARSCENGPQSSSVGGENRNVYTQGLLLETVQRSNMFPDCKTFVDMPMRYPPERILGDFELFSNCRRNDGSLYFLQMFVEKHFEPKGSELEKCTPSDWKSEPLYTDKICDIDIKQFGYKLNELWKELCYRFKDDVQCNPDMYSSIYVPNAFIVPGGRYTEYYYWDSYWILIGLLASGMHQTAKGMIDNFLYLINKYGFIPSGGRIYYYGRSHPPLLMHMMKAYVDVTKDEQYAIKSLPLLEIEFNNFRKNHKVEVQGFTMYRYQDFSVGPRPESFREDLASCSSFCNETLKEEYLSEIKSACESGMDFSSRWFINEEGTNQGTLTDTKTRCIVPVDLNAILFRGGKMLSAFYSKAGNTAKAEEYQDIACDLAKAIRDVLWNEECGIWLDYDLANQKPRPYFSVSNFFPLWTRAFPIVDREKIANSVMSYIENNQLDSYLGGVPNTLVNTGLAFDYPNVSPCMMFVLIEGLENLCTPEAKALSKRWGHRWIKSNYEAYRKDGYMFDMYNCENFGVRAACPKAETQTGFGWTNGVAIYFLSKYGNDLCLADSSDGSKPKTSVPAKKRDLIITSEDHMQLLAKDSCECEDKEKAAHSNYHTPASTEGNSSAFYTPKSDDGLQCQTEKSQKLSVVRFPPSGIEEQQRINNDNAISNIPCPVAMSNESPQICQFCGRIVRPENIDQQQSGCDPEDESPMQQQQSICPCQSEAAASGHLQQDKSTSPYHDEQPQRPQQHSLRQDKSTCVSSHQDQERIQQMASKCSNRVTGPCVPCNGSATDSTQPEQKFVSKQFPLADPKSMGFGLCSEEEPLASQSKHQEKECP
ncbi:LOW QUALITY PROTEIN: trehalase-like [Drosophila tropicalis]|uniref:LOW QUALITY PROTEIN: trehalase-like n=1 Tax=Drosophila tropicalis TaxID=46794 RepID=UPI0035ABE09A